MVAAGNDTIFALSSGTLPAGIAVVRLSGPQAFEAAEALAGPLRGEVKPMLRTFRRSDGSVLDRGLVVGFHAPRSFTGENCIEFHLHGSRAVVAAVSSELAAMPGLRLAEPGEFSRRAFENGKLDLVEVEGLADLISAETEMQRRLAVEQGFGGQSDLYMAWAERLTRARALIEAELDFADEDDVPGSVSDQVWRDVAALHIELTDHIKLAHGGEIIRDGFKVAIAGPPNAGKSTLLNALAGRDVAIVTALAGTTRDVLHVDLDIGGYLVRFLDTAGIRDSDDLVELEGIRRAQLTAQTSDLVLRLEEIGHHVPETEYASLEASVLRVGTKLDQHTASGRYDICLSAETGEGLEELRGEILRRVSSLWSGSFVPNRARQVRFLQEASQEITEALKDLPLDLRAEHLRAAAASLGRITGRVDVEQLLDVIFSQFCIGK
jgi:tRNA modification GTPase